MPRNSRHTSLWTGLTCLLTLQSQLPFANAQIAEIEKASNDSLLWGPYKPNLYFGVRPRIPKSLTGGLLWTRVEDYQTVQNSEYSHRSVHSYDAPAICTNCCKTSNADPMQRSDTRVSSTSSTATAGTNTMSAAAAVKRSTIPSTASTSPPNS